MAPRKKAISLKTKRGTTQIDTLIGRRIRTRRMEMHMSQDTLGQKLGVSFQQVQKYEKGVNRVGAARLHQICGLLETDMEYFMGDLGNNGKPPQLSKVSAYLATHDGLAIIEAMIKLQPPQAKAVLALARSLGS
jgi:transcriptional regulator with XRE-family HTH domain